jgi:hypothetical protein
MLKLCVGGVSVVFCKGSISGSMLPCSVADGSTEFSTDWSLKLLPPAAAVAFRCTYTLRATRAATTATAASESSDSIATCGAVDAADSLELAVVAASDSPSKSPNGVGVADGASLAGNEVSGSASNGSSVEGNGVIAGADVVVPFAGGGGTGGMLMDMDMLISDS